MYDAHNGVNILTLLMIVFTPSDPAEDFVVRGRKWERILAHTLLNNKWTFVTSR